jgi:anaerobic selenocysteine-containing dehydrogenase
MIDTKKQRHAGYTFEEAKKLAKKNGEKVIPTLCAMCGPNAFNCGVYAFVKDNCFVKIAGMNESPVNHGSLCAKAHAAPQWVYSPDRLKSPLKRTGKKGEGKFTEISWDEAISIIADKLKEQKEKYGSESLAILSPAYRSYNDYARRFLTVHGSPNYGHSGICAMQRAFSFMYTVADWPAAEIESTDLIIYWAKQPIYSGASLDGSRMLVDARERGAKIIAIKPSVEPDAGMADIWMPIRPGTDTALALAMLNIVINENLIDKAFVKEWCYGFDRLKDHIQRYTPSWAENITGVPADQILEVARLYANTKKAAIDLGNGIEHSPSSNDGIRAIAILISITGHLDRPGCNVFNMPPHGQGAMPLPRKVVLPERFTQEMIDKLVGPEFPKQFQPFLEGLTSAYYRIFESILTEKPYPIRSIIAPGTQPSVSTRGTKNVLEALNKLDFYVVADVARTADMDYADIVIPVATPYETGHPFEARPGMIMARNKVIEPLGNYKSMYEFFLDLGVAMGYGKDFWNGNINDCMNDQLQPFGITIDELKKHPTGIVYPSFPRNYENYEKVFHKKSPRLSGEPFLPHGKVEIYNTSFEKEGYNPLPEWREPPESLTGTKELSEKFPLVLSDYHTSKNYTAAWLRNVPYLRELQPYPVIHIHPDAASARGINNDDWVTVESPHGRIKVKAEIYPGIRPDTVMLLHGWWQGCGELGYKDLPLSDDGANVNNMYSVDPDKAYDPLITAMSSQTLVQVRKA